MQIGFIGVGLMGKPIVLRLLEKGHSVRVIAHNNRKPVEQAVAKGAEESPDLARLLRGTEALILCLSSSPVVESVLGAARPHLSRGQVVIDATTADPASTRTIADELASLGVAFADAPLTGGPEQVLAGEAGALVGASNETFERVKPILSCYCSRVLHFGPPGSGHAAKLISNALVGGMIALIADTYNLARKAGTDWQKLFEVQLQGSSNSGALRKMVGPALSGNYDGYAFSVANALKDIEYFIKMADEMGHASPLGVAVRDYFEAAMQRLPGEGNVSRLIDPALVEKRS